MRYSTLALRAFGLLLVAFLIVVSSAHGQLPFTHLLDNSTARPDAVATGQPTFGPFDPTDYNNPLGYTVPVTDGKVVAFNVGLYPSAFGSSSGFAPCSSGTENSLWTIPISGGTPTKLAGYGINLFSDQPSADLTKTCAGVKIGKDNLYYYGSYQSGAQLGTNTGDGVYQVPLAGGTSSSALVVGGMVSGTQLLSVFDGIYTAPDGTVSTTGGLHLSSEIDPAYDELFLKGTNSYHIEVGSYQSADCGVPPGTGNWQFGLNQTPVLYDGTNYVTNTIITGYGGQFGGDELVIFSSTTPGPVDCSNIVFNSGVMNAPTPVLMPGVPATAEGEWTVNSFDTDGGRSFFQMEQFYYSAGTTLSGYQAIYQLVGGSLVKIVGNLDTFPFATFDTTPCTTGYTGYPSNPSFGPLTVRGDWLVTSISGYTSFDCATGDSTGWTGSFAINLVTKELVKIVADGDVLENGQTSIASLLSLAGFAAAGSLASDGHYTFMTESGTKSGTPEYVLWITNLNAAPTQTLVSVTPGDETFGQNVTLSATVSPKSAGGVTPTGSVQFFDGSTALGTPAPLDSNGNASLTLDSLAVGVHSITAQYLGADAYQLSTSGAAQVTITLAPTSIVVSTSNPTIFTSASVTFSEQLSGIVSAAAPTGSISFLDGGTTLGTVGIDPTGQASLMVTSLAVGVHNITAVYAGDTNYAGSTSPAITETVTLPTSAGAKLSPTSLTFSSQTTGTTSTAQTVTLTNSGTAALSISSIAASGDFGQTHTCGASLAAGANCAISVTFTPSAAGTRTGTLTVTDNATGSPQTVALSGTGVATSPAATLSPTSVTFASSSVGTTSAAQTVTLTNSGTAALTISSIAAFGDFAQTHTCGASLAAGANCTISVTFAPSAAGTRTGTLTVSDNATGSPQTVALSGTGVATAPTAALSPSALTFGSQTTGTTSSAQTVTLTNSGTAALSLTSVAASGDFAVSQSCGTSIAAGAACTLSVTFTPTATGTRTGTVNVTDNATGSPQTVSLTGTGVAPVVTAPAVTLSPTSLTFAVETVGTASAAQTVTLTNSGTAALSLTSIGASGDFAVSQSCGTSLAAGGSCALSVTFTPTSTGTRTGTLSITDNATGSPQTVSLSGGGEYVTLSSSSSGLSISSAGGAATGTIQIAPVDGFTGTVNLTCTVAYQGQGTASDPPTCSLSPSQAQVTGATPVSTTLTVSTTAATASAVHDELFKGAGVSLAALLCFGLIPRRRWRRSMLLIALCVAATAGFIGCGGSPSGSSSAPPSNPGTTAGSYVVTVTATSGTAAASTTVSLSLQ